MDNRITAINHKDTYEGLDEESPSDSKALSENTGTRISNLGTQTQGRQKAT